MAVLSLFESASGSRKSASRRSRNGDLGSMSRERRLAFYLGACQALGLDASEQPLRFVRCNDGRLRLFDPERRYKTLKRVVAGSELPARLEREFAGAAEAIERGGGVSYDIDMANGDLRVREMVHAHRGAMVPTPALTPDRRRRNQPGFGSRRALR